MPAAPLPDHARLAARLRREVRADVLDDVGGKALYATDASSYRVVPDLVVVPRDVEALVDTLACAREAGAPVVMRGGGTSMAGNGLGGVVVDVSRHLTAVLDLDPQTRTAVVEPGVVLTQLNAAGRPHRLAFGADPSSGSRATLGGMIANNACGTHSVAWGTTADGVLGLEVVTGDGHRLDLRSPQADPALVAPERSAAVTDLERRLVGIGEQHALLVARRFGTFSRQISGYALQHLAPGRLDVPRLLCGSEGTLATTLRATLRLNPVPAYLSLVVLGFPDATAAADIVPALLPHEPLTVESLSAPLLDRLRPDVRAGAVAAGLPPGEIWLLCEVGGSTGDEAAAAAATLAEAARDACPVATVTVVTDPRAQGVLWACRRDGTGLATRRDDGSEAWGGWEDAAVPVPRLGEYLRRLEEVMARHGVSTAAYGHFGEGCMHMRFDFDLMSDTGIGRYRAFLEDATDLVVSVGGSVSGEHGDGRVRGELVERMYGADAMSVFCQVKRVFDPAGALNPGIVVDPPPLEENLRHHGPAHLRILPTEFAYATDAGSFAQAMRRCVGVGKCRQTSGGVMCPSYQVTREEQHSTRGRAHLLWEMVEGTLVTDGWRSTEVRDALDLCLSCKGCLGDCPVDVDVATYKAEFTHHHYKGRPWARPRSHWSMGWLPLSAALASRMPSLANRVMDSRLAPVIKRAGGIAADRDLPVFASQSFTAWARSRHTALAGGARVDHASSRGAVEVGRGRAPGHLPGDLTQDPSGVRRSTDLTDEPALGASTGLAAPGSRGRVVLWPDTFTNRLAPHVGQAAVAVLEDAGFEVELPDGPVCCGLTWVSTGQLGVARRVLRHSLGAVEGALRDGIPVVGLEPSCTAMLRHDGPELLAGSDGKGADLGRLAAAGVRTLAELLAERAPDWTPPQVGGQALVQVHCHQSAVMGFDPDAALLAAAGVDATVPDSGCCGLAGNFGFEDGHAELSRAVGERVILPAVRAADPATAVVADGFSCRTQIAQGTPRRAVHLAEILASGLDRTGKDSRV